MLFLLFPPALFGLHLLLRDISISFVLVDRLVCRVLAASSFHSCLLSWVIDPLNLIIFARSARYYFSLHCSGAVLVKYKN